MKFSKLILIVLIIHIGESGHAQTMCTDADPKSQSQFSFFTTWLSLSNFGNEETNTQHYEVQTRYHLTEKDAIGIKLATWKLFAPMGIPIWNDAFLDRQAFYPGRLRETGMGITYQRKLWKSLFTTLEVMAKKTTYLDSHNTTISSGFKLYNSYHIGYHIPLFKNKRFFFLEPQLHVNHWPVNTNVPHAF